VFLETKAAFIPNDIDEDVFSDFSENEKINNLEISIMSILIKGDCEIKSFNQSESGTIILTTPCICQRICMPYKELKKILQENGATFIK
jgi:hypothetical protein